MILMMKSDSYKNMKHQLKASTPLKVRPHASLTGEASLKHKEHAQKASLSLTEARTKNMNCRRIVGLPLAGSSAMQFYSAKVQRCPKNCKNSWPSQGLPTLIAGFCHRWCSSAWGAYHRNGRTQSNCETPVMRSARAA